MESIDSIDTVFLDRDGVINRLRTNYVTSWAQFEFLPRVKEALVLLTAAGMRVLVVTNQRAVARGLISPPELEAIHINMLAEVQAAGATISGVYVCPHDHDQCACRKPQVGLFLQAQHDFPQIAFSRSAVIGDSASDMEAGRNLGCKRFLVTQTGGEAWAGDDPRALQAADLSLDGIGPTLYDVVTRYLVPVAVHVARNS